MRPRRSLVGPFLLAASWLLAMAPAGAQELAVTLQEVAGGLDQPIGIEHAGDGSGRLFVIEQPGRIVIVQDGTVFATPFLDVTDRVTTAGGEQGLLGLAFHPDYASNGVFFIHYTEDTAGDTVIERCVVSTDDPNRGDCSAEDIIFTLPQPRANHNGGKIAFGPDGYLYIALGDGGGGGDPEENAQDTTDLHGAILRLDVDADAFPGDPDRDYAIPGDNSFVGQTGADEIWAFGLRNPWRFSFDRTTGDIWTGDVGQADWEEIDFEPAGDAGGRNYGWDVLEGAHCFEDDPPGSCDDFLNGGSTLPVLEYSSDGTGHCSVTGGFRYRGTREPQLFGVYLFADFCSGTVWGTLPNSTGDWEKRILAETGRRISSFGENENGELFLVDRSDGTLHRVVVAEDEDMPINFGHTGSWFNPGLDGQGFSVEVVPIEGGDDQLVAYWFTFAPGDPGGVNRQRWYVAQGPIDGSKAELEVTRTTGGVFDDPEDVNDPRTMGSATFEVASCTEATMSYSLDFNGNGVEGSTGEIALTRLTPNVVCEEMVSESN